jgi:hypothetical protein
MKLFFDPKVVDGQNQSKDWAYRQQRALDYLVVHIFIFIFNFPTKTHTKPKKQLYTIKNQKNDIKNSQKFDKKKKKRNVCLKVGGRFWFISYTYYNII